MKKDKIIERITKLLAMADDVSSPKEATIAANRARKLMDKYQIEIGEIENNSEFIVGEASDNFGWNNIPDWINTLAVTIAEWNDCLKDYKLNIPDGTVKTVFKGYKNDVLLATQCYEYIATTLIGLAMDKDFDDFNLSERFLYGASVIVQTRIRKLMKEREKTYKDKSGNALVPIKKKNVIAEFGNPNYEETELDDIAEMSEDERAALLSGMKAGRDISLERQIENA